MLRLAVLHNADAGLAAGVAADALAVRGVDEAVDGVLQACRVLGHDAVRVPAHEDPRALLDALAAIGADLVVNLVESLRGEARLEAAVAALLELAGLPYTGSPPLALGLALDKPLAKAVLQGNGVPVPRGSVVSHGGEDLSALRPPLIVKPSREDASHGIATDSVVHDAAAAHARAAWVRTTYRQPALVEEFVAGREFNVSILGDGDEAQVLPLAEIDFTGFPPGLPPLVTYEAKWVPDSPQYAGTPAVAARDVAPDTAAAIAATALAAHRVLGVRDYGRVDLRLDAQRGPLVLEVNPNPDLSPGAGLSRAAARAGIDHARLIERIVTAALARARAAR